MSTWSCRILVICMAQHNPIRGVLVALAQAFKYDPTVGTKDEPMELDEDGNADK